MAVARLTPRIPLGTRGRFAARVKPMRSARPRLAAASVNSLRGRLENWRSKMESQVRGVAEEFLNGDKNPKEFPEADVWVTESWRLEGRLGNLQTKADERVLEEAEALIQEARVHYHNEPKL